MMPNPREADKETLHPEPTRMNGAPWSTDPPLPQRLSIPARSAAPREADKTLAAVAAAIAIQDRDEPWDQLDLGLAIAALDAVWQTPPPWLVTLVRLADDLWDGQYVLPSEARDVLAACPESLRAAAGITP